MARPRKYNVGYTGVVKDGSKYEIIDIKNGRDTVIRFETGNFKEVDLSQLIKGLVRNNYIPSLYGVGIVGDKYSSKTIEYRVWRQYLEKHINNEIVLCEEWLCLDNFAPFITGWKSNKSKLVCDGEYYSPNTCEFIVDSTVRVCKCCGKEFHGRSVSVYCSKECLEESQNNHIKSRLTDDYFKELYKKFDSKLKCRIRLVDESSFVSVKSSADVVCLECGNTRSINRLTNLYAKEGFGCPNCAAKSTKRKRENVKTYSCKHCSKEYLLNDGHSKTFCSTECKDNSKAKGFIKICIFCKNEFKGKNTSKFCSDKCRKESTSIKAKERKLVELETKKSEFIPETKICKCCGGEFQTEYGQPKTISYCSEMCRKTMQSRKKDQARYKRMRVNGEFDRDITLEGLIEKDNNICGICGGECNKNDYLINNNGHFITGDDYPSIDHIYPISKGGTHTWDNVQLAHFRCNTLKNNKVGDTDAA